MYIDRVEIRIINSKSIVSFETDGGGAWKVWDRYIAIDGKKAFHIGNICETCSFFFERLEGANKSINPEKVVEALNNGINTLDPDLIKDLEKIIPNGKYHTVLTEISPTLTQPNSSNDYFSNEQVDLWGMDDFWNLPHSPKTEYYRASTRLLDQKTGFYELIVPTFPHNWLDKSKVEEYRKLIKNDAKPTVVALSVLDVKEPADWEGEKTITSHWCMAHYMLDGHHKTYAAALENKPLTMISFLAVEQGVSTEKDIERILQCI